ncbi:hypothetical protein QAD02_009195 [Eretmocerus hayati]|uniref:Uncharacterized protein n=1 Tax=Eretmocerus hayati TaxID=131215 RepID=A0ACC2N8R0_9HYME|nr:hypothetical protein QAD02_009195 [Eretmocerus hayati]
MDMIRPRIQGSVEESKKRQKSNFNGRSRVNFELGETVMAKDFSDYLWKKGRVVEILSAVMCVIELLDRRKLKKYVDQSRSYSRKLNLENGNGNLPKEKGQNNGDH